jgi:hypothetical protein
VGGEKDGRKRKRKRERRKVIEERKDSIGRKGRKEEDRSRYKRVTIFSIRQDLQNIYNLETMEVDLFSKVLFLLG